MTGSDPVAPDEQLPEPVRKRVASYTAGALRAMQPNQVPSHLRFAMKLRSGPLPRRLVDQLAQAVHSDPVFREQVGAQIGESDPLATRLADLGPDRGDDPAAVAALMYLTRPDGWREQLSGALAEIARAAPGFDAEAAAREIAALSAKLERSEQRRDREVQRARSAEQEARKELAEVGERLRKSLSEATDAAATAQREVASLLDEVVRWEREARKSRSQLDQLLAQTEWDKSTAKQARLTTTARAQVLFEVLGGAVAGLQQELAIPATAQRPADLVAAREPSEAVTSKRLASSGQLADALTLPATHLIVDGYNVTKGTWPTAALQQQRDRLLLALAPLQARTGAEITVVFDGAAVGAVPSVSARGLRVRFSEPGEPADTVIVRLVRAEPVGRPVIVVSSDAWLTTGARSAGARSADREVLGALLGLAR